MTRKLVLGGIAIAGGSALLIDRTMLGEATAGLEALTVLAEESRAAETLVASIGSGEPPELQSLLDSLASKEGLLPGQVDSSLFSSRSLSAGVPAQTADDPATASAPPDSLSSIAQESGDGRVTMVMSSQGGGMAMIDGVPLRVGQTAEGVTLLRVHANGVTVRENESERFLALR